MTGRSGGQETGNAGTGTGFCSTAKAGKETGVSLSIPSAEILMQMEPRGFMGSRTKRRCLSTARTGFWSKANGMGANGGIIDATCPIVRLKNCGQDRRPCRQPCPLPRFARHSDAEPGQVAWEKVQEPLADPVAGKAARLTHICRVEFRRYLFHQIVLDVPGCRYPNPCIFFA